MTPVEDNTFKDNVAKKIINENPCLNLFYQKITGQSESDRSSRCMLKATSQEQRNAGRRTCRCRR